MSSPKVQHVSKAASDKLLVKFSDVSAYDFVYRQNGGPQSPVGMGFRKKRASRTEEADAAIVSWRTPLNGTGRRGGLVSNLRSVGRSLKSSQMTVAHIRTYDLLSAAAEKAWRKALRGASKCLVEKHTVQAVHLRKEIL